MDLFFPDKQQRTQDIQLIINLFRNTGQIERFEGQGLSFLYVQPSVISLENFRILLDQGIQITGFTVYLRLATIDYNNNDVTTGVRGDTREEENPTPPPDTITVNQKWNEWAEIARERNDNGEVIIGVPYQPTSDELNLFEDDAQVLEIMGAGIVLNVYDNDVDWVTEPPVEKDPVYWTQNWATDGEAFDFLHAQRLVIAWYTQAQIDSGLGNQAFWDSLSNEVKTEAIRWGVLPNNGFGGSNIEAHVPNKRDRGALRKWHIDKLIDARKRRFDDGYSLLKDNFENAALEGYVNDYFTYRYMQSYIYFGESSGADNLIINGVLNATWTAQWDSNDLMYSDQSLAAVQNQLERILDADRY